MLYQEYQQKIEKLAKIRKFLFRYRVLFILLIASILSLTITLMAISGTVTDTSCPTSFTYGESIDYTAGAIMSDVTYEYSVDGVTWTTVAPIEVGTYKVRAVSHGIFGSTRTGDVHEFTIEPLPTVVSIVESSVVYGDIPTVTASLSYNDTIYCSEFTFADPTADSTTVIPVKDKIVIVNEEGEEVTSSYNLQINSSTITIDKRPITLTVSNQTTTYSDSAFSYHEYEISSGSVAKENGFNDQVQAVFTKSIINVGEITNETTFTIVNNKGQDVTHKYQITSKIGKLTVEHRSILIDSNAININYDGLDHEEKGYSIKDGSLVDGHTLIVTSATTVHDANGEGIDNIQTYKILDSKNNDVTDNYSINVTRQKLVVNKRPITIQSATTQLVYNDKPQSDKNTSIISKLNLVNDDVVNVILAKNLQYVSSAENVIECRILTKDNDDNTDNYEISYEFGTLEIVKREVSILTNSPTFTYNGQEQYDIGYTVTSTLGFVDKHKVIIDNYPTIKTITQSGTLNIITIHINDAQGTNVSDNNYLIKIEPGTLSMTTRNIKIKSNSSSYVYDAEDHFDITYDDTLNTAENEGLVTGETISIATYTIINEVGTKNNIFDDVSIYSGSDNVTKNYSIDLSEYGTLEVVKRNITIKVKDLEKVYDGTPLGSTNNDYDVTNTAEDEGLVNEKFGHTITCSISGTITDYSETPAVSTLNSAIIKDANDKDMIDNYNITLENGTLTIKQREITVATGSKEFTYDATAHTCIDYSITSELNLVSGHELSVISSTPVTDVIYDADGNISSVDNVFTSVQIVDKNNGDADKTSNYFISYTNGKLTVNPAGLTITADSKTKEYDGTALTISNTEFKSTGLISAHTLTVEITGSATDVQENPVASVPTNAKILDTSENDVTANYTITYINGTLTITPKPITIETITPASKAYDGTPLKGTYSAPDICDVDEIKDSNIKLTELTNVEENVALEVESILITKKADEKIDSTKNYTITYKNGTLTVTKRPISIKSHSSSYVYDAEEHFDINYDILNTAEDEGLVSGEKITIVKYATITDVGSKDNIFETIQIFSGENETTSNYEINLNEYGTITVTKRNITIKANDLEKVYDGTPLGSTNNDYDVTNTAEDEGLVNEKFGHTITCSISGTITDYSETPAVSTLNSAIIKDANDKDMIDNYNITLENGTLTIKQREITVATGSKEFTYDATAHTCIDYSITSELNLVSGHELLVISSTPVTDVYYLDGNISSVDNEFTSVQIVDKNNGYADKTSNYFISYTKGKLTVNPAGLTITADSKTKEYDGTALTISNIEFKSTGLISAHTLTVEITGSATDVQENPVASVPTNAKILDASENDVTANYTITYINGTLTITPKPITITIVSATKVYDGTPHTGTYTVTGLCESYDEIQSVNIKLTELTNVGNVQIMVESIKITKLVGYADSTANYDISYINGYIEVTKRPISIKSHSSSYVYDAEEHFDINYDILNTAEDEGLVSGEKVTIVKYATITDVGSKDNIFETIQIFSGENETTSNYAIDLNEYGTITVTKRNITITINDYSTEYNGSAQTQTNQTAYEITDGSLVDGQTIKADSISFTGSQTAVGEYSETIGIDVGKIIILAGEIEVQDNYTITVDKGKLTITKRTIEIITQSKSFTYDGKAHSYYAENAGYKIVKGSLLDGHTLTVDSYPTITNVADGEVDNILTFSMDSSYSGYYDISIVSYIDYKQVNKSIAFNNEKKYYTYDSETEQYVLDETITLENYEQKCVSGLYIEVTRNYGIISITPLDITITTGSLETTYDGYEHYNNEYTIDDKTVLDAMNHYIYITSYAKIKDVYYENNEVSSIKNIIVVEIREKGTTDVDQSSNYNIIYVTGTLKLNPLAITVTTDSLEKVYDGTALDGTYQKVTGLADNDYISITCPSLTDAKIINNVAEIELYRFDSDNTTHISVLGNYSITRVEGTLTVKQRPIYFTIKNGTWEYDGEKHDAKDYVLTDADTNSGIISSHKIIVNEYAQIRNVGTITNFITPIIVEVANEENIVTSNYDIQINDNTTLTVTKVNLTISLKDVEFMYDGTIKSSNDVSTQGLATSDYLIVHASAGEAIIPDEYENNITKYEITSSTGEDSVSNYNVLIANGTLTITQRTITIESEECHEVYKENTTYNHNVVNITSENQLVSGHKLITTTITLTGKYTEGTPNKILTYDIVNENDETISYKDYYDVTIVEKLYYIGNPYIYIASPTVEAFYDVKTELQSTEADFIIDDSFLNEEHTIVISNFAKLTGIGTTSNTFDVDIVDSEGHSVLTDDDGNPTYDIKTDYGTLTIRKRNIIITTGGCTWIYDGEVHSNSDITIDDSDLKDEKYELVCSTPNKEIKEPNTDIYNKEVTESILNTVSYNIKMNGEDISSENIEKYFDITTNFGELIVKRRPIYVQSASDEVVYDENHTTLSNSQVIILDDSYLLEGHTIQTSILTAANGICEGTENETVKESNTIDSTQFIVLDSEGNDVTKYYALENAKLGTLTIYASKDAEDSDTEQIQITIVTTDTGLIYLKTFVCGEYTGKGALPFKNAEASTNYINYYYQVDKSSAYSSETQYYIYDSENEVYIIDETITAETYEAKCDSGLYISIQYSADYITSLILEKYGKTAQTATIINYLDGYYPLPYYMALAGTYTKQTSDALYAGDTTVSPYTVSYYTMSMAELSTILAQKITLPEEYQEAEATYYAAISSSSSQYMQIDSDTKTYMDTIIKNNNLDSTSLSTYQRITAVASYIQASAEYSLEYNEALDDEDNVVIAFLDEYQVGVCRHFATAATMLYRALDIPARVAVGFVTNVETAKEAVDITLATYHAWVEVYIQGYGWIPVEVTGGSNYGGYNSTGEEKETIDTPDALTLTVAPVDVTVEYDGDTHVATEIEIIGSEEYDGIAALEALGYEFTYTLSGSGIIPGEYTSKILTLHISKDGTDITDACSITTQTGTITIEKAKVTIKSSDGYWTYDGETHEKNSYTITSGAIVEGDQEYVSCTTKIKDIGELNNDFTYLILNSDGNDITDYYEVTKDYGTLEVSKIGLSITTNSASKVYDGTPLTNTKWSVDENLIAGKLLDGHKIYMTITGTITEPGLEANTATCTILDENDKDVTDTYYIINIKTGILEVTSKKVTVKTTGYARNYNGEPIYGASNTTASWEGSVDTSLYTVTLTITGATDGANAQSVDNTCTIKITENETGNDVTDEYEINYDLGLLAIYKIRLYIETGSKSIYYDGVTTVSCPEYDSSTVSGLLNNGTHINTIYTAQDWSTLTTIPDGATLTTNSKGESVYKIRNRAQFVIVDENNNDVSENYDLQDKDLGYLSLIKKQISIKSGSATKEYDGTPLTLSKDNDTSFVLDDSTIFDGHTVTATQTGTITDVGTVENTYTIIITDSLGNDVTYLYDIETNFGKLTVTKRQVIITTGSDSKKYDGTPLTCNEYSLYKDDSILEDLGHVLVVNITGSTIDETVDNTATAYVYKLVDGEKVILDDCYQIKIVYGTLTIITRDLAIKSNGKTKVYDGKPLTNNGDDQITILGKNNLEDGHELVAYIEDSVSITKVGSITNTVTYKVIDTNNSDKDVTNLYNITELFGSLIITEKIITIKTGSKKSSDTTSPVTYDYYEIIDGVFYDEYTISITGSQAEIGSSYNTYELNCVNKDCYSFIEYLGILTMYDASNPDYYAQIYSNASGTIVLKETSYGEYTKTSWASATEYSNLLDDKYSMSYLNALSLSGLTAAEIRILAYYTYALPYFLAMDENSIQTSDTIYSGSISGEYLASFYICNIIDNIASLSINLGDYADDEAEYRTFVYNTYLEIPTSTKNALASRLDFSSLDDTSSTYINDIIAFIKNCGTNDSNYSKAIDSSSDLAISFLDYKKGISKHFATLGTLVFRYLGIPARYVVGAIGKLEANKWSSISSDNMKSYVEIYINGFGWVPVDVTPEVGVTPHEDDDDDEKTTLSITPVLTEASYTGGTITPTQKLDETEETLAKLLAEGYTYEVTITTDEVAKTDNGISTITSFKLKDKNGNIAYDSTADAETLASYDFEVTFNTGVVKITHEQIKVYLTSIQYIYDGTEHTYGGSDVFFHFAVPSTFLKDDFSLLIDKTGISLTQAGSVDYDVLRNAATVLKIATEYKDGTTYYTSDGTIVSTITDSASFEAYESELYTDVTNSFYLVFSGKGLVVEKNAITITSGSASKAFDGTTLTCDDYTITLGSLADGDTITVTITGSLTDVDSKPNSIESVVIKNSSNEDVTDSYDITLVEGTLTIT